MAASASFGIAQNDVAHILTMLRDTLYSDWVLAVLREYAANAWDAHREVGKGDVPIQVTLPTLQDPTLEIRDFGTGLSREDMMGRFLLAGASTKRGSNLAVGTLGIGRLSGFAYGDSFVVESRYGGVCSTYVAVIDASERGRIDLLDEQSAADTGLAIRLSVRASDVRVGDGVLLESGGWSAVMGCVSYPIDLSVRQQIVAIEYEAFSVGSLLGTSIVMLPHPSGLNRAWNAEHSARRARAALRKVGAL